MSDIKEVWTDNRIAVVGPKQHVARFRNSNWEGRLQARYGELIESSDRRFVCEFKTVSPPTELLRRISSHWSKLAFLLDYELQHQRVKGLAKAEAGELQDYKISY